VASITEPPGVDTASAASHRDYSLIDDPANPSQQVEAGFETTHALDGVTLMPLVNITLDSQTVPPATFYIGFMTDTHAGRPDDYPSTIAISCGDSQASVNPDKNGGAPNGRVDVFFFRVSGARPGDTVTVKASQSVRNPDGGRFNPSVSGLLFSGKMPPEVAQASQQPTAPPAASSAEPVVNFDYFHDQLAPYGTWVQVPGYGWCWRPDAAINANPDWRPYYDMGQWVYTENGWFWQSDYNWGDIPFHYGRWIRDPGYGWLWVPDYTWGPAWVFWRQAEADGYVGWAPLPYGAVWAAGGWWEFHGQRVAVDFDFGLGENFFVFVGYDHFHDGFIRLRGREYTFHVRPERVHEFYRRTVIRNESRRDEHGRLVNDGIGRERIERLTQHKVEERRFDERDPVGDRNRLKQQPEQGDKTGKQLQTQVHEPNKVYRPPVSQGDKGSQKPANAGTHSGK
jgi:hypothetical protein